MRLSSFERVFSRPVRYLGNIDIEKPLFWLYLPHFSFSGKILDDTVLLGGMLGFVFYPGDFS